MTSYIQDRLQRVADAARCRRCGLSLVGIRQQLRATVEVVRRELPAERAEDVIEELRIIWTQPTT
jgi:hypothetical protein